ncbi:hypothetical protein [Actinoplanes sp. NPDC026619]|uniref:hypothetical protein n=1 Tax=Actinoplanes sp. NPDC026619 TaxID=3155798 RepID=UPI0033E4CE3E
MTATVKRELLVRHLEAWAPAALHRGRRVVYTHGFADADGGESAEAAARVLVDQTDFVRGRELSMLLVGEQVEPVRERVAAVVGDAALVVHAVSGGTDARLAVALKAGGAHRVPLLGFLDASASEPPAVPTVAALTAGKPAEVLLVLPPGVSPAPYREGWPLSTSVELATGEDPGELLVFGTTSGKSLESFKEALWAVDEFAGVRYRDPGDPDRHLIDISLSPHPGPLRRELLAHLSRVGSATVTELRTFALTSTIYRAADVTRVLHTLIDSDAVTRQPPAGRLGGDVVIALG